MPLLHLAFCLSAYACIPVMRCICLLYGDIGLCTIRGTEVAATSLITLAAILVIALSQKPFALLILCCVCFAPGLLSSRNKLSL